MCQQTTSWHPRATETKAGASLLLVVLVLLEVVVVVVLLYYYYYSYYYYYCCNCYQYHYSIVNLYAVVLLPRCLNCVCMHMADGLAVAQCVFVCRDSRICRCLCRDVYMCICSLESV